MTPRDHNKTISISYGLIGLLSLIGLIVLIVIEIRKSPPPNHIPRLSTAVYFLPLPLLNFLASYGLIMKRRWGRLLALLLSIVYVWIFPLGTALAIYTWYFLHSPGGKALFQKRGDTARPKLSVSDTGRDS
jgi:hypothetical protein